jgi:putative acetyltransferase
LGQRLAEIENGRIIMLVADIDSQIVSVGEVEAFTGERSHTGYLGIGVSKNNRRTGLGRGMMLALLALSEKIGLKIIILDVFATNAPAIRLYETVGFKEIGRIPKGILRDGNYLDLVRMATEI